MKNTILITIFTALIAANDTSKAGGCDTAWTNADRVKLHQLYKMGANSEIKQYIRYHRAKLNSCNSDLSVDRIMDIHYLNDVSIIEQEYDEKSHAGGRY